VAPYVIKRGVSAGLFWFMRESFEAVGGFDESLVSVEDVDFGIRLKARGQAQGRNPRLVKEIFEGTNRRAADHFYYDVER